VYDELHFLVKAVILYDIVFDREGYAVYRRITEADRALYLRYVKAFYHSGAVFTPVPEENYHITFDEMMRSDDYMWGYILEDESGGAAEPCGFALLSKTFSQEAGGISVTLEEIYIEPEHRGKGIGTRFLRDLCANQAYKRIRLEVEDDNLPAKKLYERMGFIELPYLQMVIDRWRDNSCS
jgi:ribosomal protein S18 acetylase RimI-like enzyme